MKTQTKKFWLTAHILASIGWMGAVAAFLVLAIFGLQGGEEVVVHSAYVAMKLVTDFVILPLCFASLLTGVWQSVGTKWGLFQHYWIVFKLAITVVSTAVLLLHTRPIAFLADLAIHSSISGATHYNLRLQLVVNAVLAIIALLVATVLAVYKPKGLTPYGLRVQRTRSQ